MLFLFPHKLSAHGILKLLFLDVIENHTRLHFVDQSSLLLETEVELEAESLALCGSKLFNIQCAARAQLKASYTSRLRPQTLVA